MDFPTEEEPLDITETRQVKRITTMQVLRSAFDAFNVDRGGVFTVKRLFVNPGKGIKNYLGANRYHYTPPFRLLIVTTAIALLVISKAEVTQSFGKDIVTGIENGAQEKDKTEQELMMAKFNELTNTLKPYSNLILWTFVPLFALFVWLINLKGPFNFAEHVVFQTYMFSISNILSLILIFDHFLPISLVLIILYAGMFAYYVYGYKVFTGKKWFRSFLEIVLSLIIVSAVWSAVLGILFGMLLAFSMNQV